MGMGWPQQLDVRLDGKLLKRFTVGGKAQGPARRGQLRRRRRAGLCRRLPMGKVHADRRRRGARGPRAGRGRARASSACRSCASCGSRKACRSRCSAAACSRTTRSTWTTRTSARSRSAVRIRRRGAGEGHAEPPRDLRLSAEGAGGRAGLRHEDPLADGPARLSPAGDRARMCRRCSTFFDERPARRRRLRRRHSVRARADAGRSGFPAARAIAIRPARRRGGLSPERSRARLAAVVLPVEQHSRRAPADARRARPADQPADPRTAGAADAGRPARHRRAGRRLRRAVAEPAPRRRSGRRSGSLSELRRQPAPGVQAGDRAVRRQHAPRGSQRPRSAARRLHVRQRAAGAPLRHSRASTAAASGASRSRTAISAAGCSRMARCWRRRRIPDRTSPVLRGKWLLDNIFGVPVPPPPPGVDTNLPEAKPGAAPPIDPRAAGAASHESGRATAATRSIDPLGFALENFDAIGGWRTIDEAGQAGRRQRHDGERREGRRACRACGRCCSSSPSSFRARSPRSCWPTRSAGGSSTTISRRCEQIVRDAAAHDYRWSSLILGIVKSPAFLMRTPAARRLRRI